MKRLLLVLLTTLALGGVALAEDKPSSGSGQEKSNAMKGPPNADGAQKGDASDKTGTGSGGAASAKATGEAEGGQKK